MSKSRLFGTDGVRGVANSELTAELALELGIAAGTWVNETAAGEIDEMSCGGNGRASTATVGCRREVIIGRDTRLSGDMLEAALAAGLSAAGVDVLNVGIVPTPAVAQIVLERSSAAGVVISASHNPFEDNGIKFFGSSGKKLPDRVEDGIEKVYRNARNIDRPKGGAIGRIVESTEPVAAYRRRVEDSIATSGKNPLRSLRIVLDCANGAAYDLAPRIFQDLGATVDVIHNTPDGVNINVNCGSTHPKDMAARVRQSRSHVGLAFDGDADRVMLADENGDIVDGDRMMAIIGLFLKSQDKLPGNTVVATIMSNLGLEQALAKAGIKLIRTDVGDRYVAEAMEAYGSALGGEQSGHILLPFISPTGDGMVTALQVLRVMSETSKPLSELASVVQSCPQLLKSIRVRTKQGWQVDTDINAAIHDAGKRLGSTEWLSVRASGTEPLIRVMAQGNDKAAVEEAVNGICDAVAKKLGSA